MYIIIEIQKSNDGSAAICPPATYAERQSAECAYHTALAAASISQIDVHSVCMMSYTGERIKGETYYHGQSPVE